MITTEDHICPINKEPCREDCAWNVNEKKRVRSGTIVKKTKPLCAAAVIGDSLRLFVQTLMEDSADE
mgnify:CR=1 FL=1